GQRPDVASAHAGCGLGKPGLLPVQLVWCAPRPTGRQMVGEASEAVARRARAPPDSLGDTSIPGDRTHPGGGSATRRPTSPSTESLGLRHRRVQDILQSLSFAKMVMGRRPITILARDRVKP